jgi:hypothetical protein
MTDWPPYRWMPLRSVLAHLPEMEKRGVSRVARSSRGFLATYAALGTADATKDHVVPGYPGQTWEQRRRSFIARHLPQYEANPTRRRWLALVAWAYRPGGAAP